MDFVRKIRNGQYGRNKKVIMIYLYTQEFFWSGKIKAAIKKILGRNFGGPLAVERSLIAGLTELGTPFVINKKPKDKDIACVLNGSKVLEWAIKQKTAGRIQKLLAGPNIAITPFDNDRLILNPAIDGYVVPAEWSVKWWSGLAPALAPKLKVWPAGVRDHGSLRDANGLCLVYVKTVSAELSAVVESVLIKLGVKYKLLSYGSFQPSDYLKLLKQSSHVIYLTEHESQGLALHEAWMGDVPTLVWDAGGFTYNNNFVVMDGAAAPYLNPLTGMSFKGAQDFETVYNSFRANQVNFKPRQYSLSNFTDKKSAEKYLEIIKTL